MRDVIESNFEEKNDRELAKELDVSESQVKNIRREEGFLRLDKFKEDDQISSVFSLNWELDEMEKRKLQGFLGEKVTKLLTGKVKNHLKNFTRDNWVLRDKIYLVNSSNTIQRYWANSKPIQGGLRVEGKQIKHDNKSEEKIKEHISEKCVIADNQLFKKFKKLRNPFIDFNFYIVKKTGTENVKYKATNYGKLSNNMGGENISVEVPKIEDFKIIMLEVKTTRKNAESLLTENQRKARDIAKESPYLEFFTIKVNREFEELNIPSNYEAKLEKHT